MSDLTKLTKQEVIDLARGESVHAYPADMGDVLGTQYQLEGNVSVYVGGDTVEVVEVHADGSTTVTRK